ncbi:hypothetical protein KUTeg_004132 [Tegillarca granosa]|uniref:DBB domain-containing protein n=1 Tax=Tegillarca granosa TaxID=220873 RepID=A0ABQ9FP24_TEGGR|nr:hypothetical protein KUTeg_004132 [Tegillarca granosa]
MKFHTLMKYIDTMRIYFEILMKTKTTSLLPERMNKSHCSKIPQIKDRQSSFARVSISKTSSSDVDSDYDVPQSMADLDYDVPPSGLAPDYDVPKAIRPKEAKSNKNLDACSTFKNVDNKVYRVLQNFNEELPTLVVEHKNNIIDKLSKKGFQVQEVYVLLDRPANDEVILDFEDGQIQKMTLLNKVMYQTELRGQEKQFKIKEGSKILGDSNIKTFKIKQERSKAELIKDLLLDETDPISLLCTSFGISGKTSKSLDRYLEAKCKLPNIAKTLYQNFKCTDTDADSKDADDGECPSLLHFCSEYNLVKFCEALLAVPGMSRLCHKLNSRNETALQVAKRHNHTEVIYLIETKINEERDSGIQERCSSQYDFEVPESNQANDFSEKTKRDSNYMQMDPQDTSIFFYLDLSEKRKRDSNYMQMDPQDTNLSEKRKRDSNYMQMDPQDLHVQKPRETLTRDSNYIPMDSHDHDKPCLPHSHSESEASDMYRSISGNSSVEDNGKSSSLPSDQTQNQEICYKEKSSMSSGTIMLPTNHHKTHNPIKKLMQAFYRGHDEAHEHKHERQRRKSLKERINQYLPEEKTQERCNSIRIHRVLKDNNIKVLRLPEKKTYFKQNEKSEWFDNNVF